MIYIHTYKSSDLSDEQLRGIFQLLDTTWPDFKPKEDNWEKRKSEFHKTNPLKQCHVLFDDFEVIGYAETFERTVSTGNQMIKLMGLGSVCVSKDYRGKGLGADIIKICFGRVSHGEFPVCLFQTGVPEFYEKLNCQSVDNQFIDSTHPDEPYESPFWDDHIMIYPKNHDWPNGQIDLLGRGY